VSIVPLAIILHSITSIYVSHKFCGCLKFELIFFFRDIKPRNILIDKVGHVKLGDFNAASCLNSDGKVTTPYINIPYESQQYAAPEVLQSLEDNFDVVSIFFALFLIPFICVILCLNLSCLNILNELMNRGFGFVCICS